VNGEAIAIDSVVDAGYAHVEREWRLGDVVRLDLDMPAERVYAHPDVTADVGRVALKRGPIVYCVETADNDAPVHRLALPRASAVEAGFDAGLLGGAGVLVARALVAEPRDPDALYAGDPPPTRTTVLRAIPYAFWNNRSADAMAVWIPEA
jgi:DUF1680 family protein